VLSVGVLAGQRMLTSFVTHRCIADLTVVRDMIGILDAFYRERSGYDPETSRRRIRIANYGKGSKLLRSL
jgi:hypothetical protein